MTNNKPSIPDSESDSPLHDSQKADDSMKEASRVDPEEEEKGDQLPSREKHLYKDIYQQLSKLYKGSERSIVVGRMGIILGFLAIAVSFILFLQSDRALRTVAASLEQSIPKEVAELLAMGDFDIKRVHVREYMDKYEPQDSLASVGSELDQNDQGFHLILPNRELQSPVTLTLDWLAIEIGGIHRTDGDDETSLEVSTLRIADINNQEDATLFRKIPIGQVERSHATEMPEWGCFVGVSTYLAETAGFFRLSIIGFDLPGQECKLLRRSTEAS